MFNSEKGGKKFRKFEVKTNNAIGASSSLTQPSIVEHFASTSMQSDNNSSNTVSTIPSIASDGVIGVNDNEDGNGNVARDDKEREGENAWNTVTSKNSKNHHNNEPMVGGAKRTSAKVTPIQIEQMDVHELKKLGADLSKKVNGNNMYLHQIGSNKMPRIFCENEETKAVVIAHLNLNEIQYNSFNNGASRKRAFIVRGLVGYEDDESIELIRDAIIEMGVLGEFEIGKFQTPYQRFHPSDKRTPLYRIVVGANVDDKMLLDIRTIGYCRVRVELMKKSPVMQCHRCQRFHHTTGQCNFNYRCVQCVNMHRPGECPRRTNKNLPLGCVNCNEEKLTNSEHTANDLKNCGYYKKKLDGQQAQKERTHGKSTTTSNTGGTIVTGGDKQTAASGTSYATALKKGAMVGGLTAAQLTEIISQTVKGVLAAIGNGI